MRFHTLMRLLRAPEPLDHPAFVYERKLDGFRALAIIRGDGCELIRRTATRFVDLALA
jgi:ATP-dependent DNA ligase